MAVAHKIAEKCIWSMDGVDYEGQVMSCEIKDSCTEEEIPGPDGQTFQFLLSNRMKTMTIEVLTSGAPSPGTTLEVASESWNIREVEELWTLGKMFKWRAVGWISLGFS